MADFFESVARQVEIDGQPMIGVWGDGVMLSCDNGKSPWMPGSAPSDVRLEEGKRYRITVEERVATVTAEDQIAALEIACHAEREGVERAERSGNPCAAEINRQRLRAAENRLLTAMEQQTGMQGAAMTSDQINVGEFEQAITCDPNTSGWLKEQLVNTKERDVVDALNDAQALVTALKGRIAVMR